MKNLDQIRAGHALKHAENLAKEDVNKVPGLIINNGLLAATAFAYSKKQGMQKVFDALKSYLLEQKVIRQGIIEDLTADGVSATKLQCVTDESLAYLSFLKRFAKKGES